MKTFGIGADVSKEEWSDVIRDLIAQHYLAKAEGTYPVLVLTENSAQVLQGNQKVMIAKAKEKIVAEEPETQHEEALFQQLKDTRRVIAGKENVPAYIVLSDATLMELATYLPQTKDDLGKISGFGEVKLDKYGAQFLDVVTAYSNERQLSSRMELKTPKRIRKERPERETNTRQQSFELFRQGNTIAEIAELRKFSPITIEGHLAFYVEQGKLSIEQLMDTSKLPAIQQAIEQLGSKMLAPIKEHLGENYTYNEIRMVIAHLESLKRI